MLISTVAELSGLRRHTQYTWCTVHIDPPGPSKDSSSDVFARQGLPHRRSAMTIREPRE